jgi:ABC-2 type transport system ATP-binding protein
MHQVEFQSVRKVFYHRPALFNWIGRERTGSTVALAGISFSSRGSEVIALLGPNGSGKTTTLKLISTMLFPDEGSVRVEGLDSRQGASWVRRQVGIAIATERSFFPRLSARENLDFFAALDEVPRGERPRRIRGVLRETGLEEHADTLAMKFSSGMYQRLGLARALAKQPKVLLLDEPTRSLDASSTEDLWATIRRIARDGTTVFLATHNFSEAAVVADRLLLLHRGNLLADRALHPGEQAEDLRRLYFSMTGENHGQFDEISNVFERAGDRS